MKKYKEFIKEKKKKTKKVAHKFAGDFEFVLGAEQHEELKRRVDEVVGNF